MIRHICSFCFYIFGFDGVMCFNFFFYSVFYTEVSKYVYLIGVLYGIELLLTFMFPKGKKIK